MNFRHIKQVERLPEAETRYPLNHRIDDTVMVKDVDRRWTPEQDPRI
jgi:hypothetical protein